MNSNKFLFSLALVLIVGTLSFSFTVNTQYASAADKGFHTLHAPQTYCTPVKILKENKNMKQVMTDEYFDKILSDNFSCAKYNNLSKKNKIAFDKFAKKIITSLTPSGNIELSNDRSTTYSIILPNILFRWSVQTNSIKGFTQFENLKRDYINLVGTYVHENYSTQVEVNTNYNFDK